MRCACKCDAIRQVQALRRSCRRSPETENEALPNRRAHVGKVIDAGANDYITKLENAHGTEFRELLYPWHPWAGLRVGLHESVSKPDGSVFRCRPHGRRLEIPAWMFDHLHAPGCVLRLMRMSTLGHWRRSWVLRHRMHRFRAHQNSPTTRIRERCMQLRIKQPQRRRRAAQPIDLFAGEPHNAIGNMPAWSMLPRDVRAALTSLITLLLLEHAAARRIGSMAETDHDL